MRRRQVMSGRLSLPSNSGVLSTSVETSLDSAGTSARTTYAAVASIHHHAAHLHWFEQNPDADSVQCQGKRSPWQKNAGRSGTIHPISGDAPDQIERQQKPGIEQENLCWRKPMGQERHRRKTPVRLNGKPEQ